MSLSARRAWIEIRKNPLRIKLLTLSLSARRAWIEIALPGWWTAGPAVALRKESVDRNRKFTRGWPAGSVALRKESVDRNTVVDVLPERDLLSLSARRAWIEIAGAGIVGNTDVSRSPQGERG